MNIAYLRLDGVKGDSSMAPFSGWIELASFSFGPVAISGSSVGSAQLAHAFTTLDFTCRAGRHSPVLSEMMAKGKQSNGELAIADGGRRIATAILQNALVAQYIVNSDSGEPLETFRLDALPFKVAFATRERLVGHWNVTIGKWHGVFVFESGGTVSWTERNTATRHGGKWQETAADVQWKFFTAGDNRTFVITVPIPDGPISGRILPAGQGAFSMTRV